MNTDYLINAENEYRRERVARGIAASRAGRSRSSWLRRVAASDPSVAKRTR